MTNKETVIQFYEKVFNGWDISVVDQFVRNDYIQHNPNVESGIEGFKGFLDKFLSLKPHMDIVKIAQEDDMVFVFFKCTLQNGAVNKVCDIYRLEDGKLAEHWDVVEHDVDKITPVHNNGLF